MPLLPPAAHLKENVPHGTLRFGLSVHETRQPVASDIMLYLHWHEDIEILTVLDGAMTFHAGGRDFPVSAGDVVVLPSDTLHGASRLGHAPCTFSAVVFSPAFVLSSVRDTVEEAFIEPYFIRGTGDFCHLTPAMPEHPVVCALTAQIRHLHARRPFGWELLTRACVLGVLGHCLAHLPVPLSRPDPEDARNTQRLRDMLQFMETHYSRKFSLSEWAAATALSREQFCRVFRKALHMSPMAYLLHFRINKAAGLLAQTRLPVIQIALETGFESANYFAIAFRRLTGMSPSAFRNKRYSG